MNLIEISLRIRVVLTQSPLDVTKPGALGSQMYMESRTFTGPSEVSRRCPGTGSPHLELHKLKKVFLTHRPQAHCSPTDLRSRLAVSTDL